MLLAASTAVVANASDASPVPPDSGSSVRSPHQDAAPAGPSSAERPAFVPPTVPLDPRIKSDRITESDPPALPAELHQPLAASLRIATDPAQVPLPPALQERARAALTKGLDYLRAKQAPNGGWMETASAAPSNDSARPAPVAVAVTALALKALAQATATAPADDPAIERAAGFIASAQRPDGTFDDGGMSSYVHSCVVAGLASLQDARMTDRLQQALRTLIALQWDQGEGVSARQDWFGGVGYGHNGRPDLSNTQLMLDALHDAGVSPDDPAVQRALAFVVRAQNLKSTNSATWAQAGPDDGGFVYTPANGGESMASQAAGEGRYGELLPDQAKRSLRSYGSMTYAGFKSLLYCGLAPDDLRVRAAYDWIRRHFSFHENPGMGQEGLYYYYHAMARALVAAQQPTIIPLVPAADGTDAVKEGTPQNWRLVLVESLLERQRDDGSWLNTADRWLEGNPELCTIYAALALEEVLKEAPAAEKPAPKR
ncbi:MAG: hypothetical protein KDA22_16710 [Phycisphaerales bacterium]|nr:hypothetical protein [Phycisphaerales bacterium]